MWLFHLCVNISDDIHLCRNRGGTDETICSTTRKYGETAQTGKVNGQYKDPMCGKFKPIVRYCHISAFNNPSNGIYYRFTKYANFDSASARSTCHEVGGVLPHLETELDAAYLEDMMEYLLGYVTLGQPFSLRYASWPVSNILYLVLDI